MAVVLAARTGWGTPSASLPVTEVTAMLAHAGERVEAFFLRAQSLVCTETVSIQPLTTGMSRDGFGRTVESELRLSWDGSVDGAPVTEAQTWRKLLRVNRRPPRANDRDKLHGP